MDGSERGSRADKSYSNPELDYLLILSIHLLDGWIKNAMILYYFYTKTYCGEFSEVHHQSMFRATV